MLIFNIKVNKKNILKIILAIMLLIAISITVIGIYNILSSKEIKMLDKNDNLNDTIPMSDVAKITKENYTNILKEVHENIDTYIGQKISFSGYVYRINNFKENEFVLARDMDIGNNQTLIVGFLCSCNNAKEFDSYSWVEIEGEITKGKYNNQDIPIISIYKINRIDMPEDPNVSLPDDAYVPTAVIY